MVIKKKERGVRRRRMSPFRKRNETLREGENKVKVKTAQYAATRNQLSLMAKHANYQTDGSIWAHSAEFTTSGGL